jgi:exosortase A
MKRDALPIALPAAGPTDEAAARWRHALVPLGATLAWILAWYWDTATAMAGIWARSETFAHGFIVAPISLWLIWRMRATLRMLAPRPSWVAVPALALAGFAWLVGDVGAVNAVSQGSFVTLVVLAVPAILGIEVARAMMFPLLFLFFCVPLGEFLLPVLMERTADFTVLAVRASGVPVYREGLQFVIPSGRWSVVEACSGIRYLIASLMAGTLFAYLNYRSMWRRLVFIAVAIALPIVANWLRAYMIVMLGHLSDNRIAAGVDHLIYGWVFFGLVMLLMFWVGAKWREEPAVAAAAAPASAARAMGNAPAQSDAPVQGDTSGRGAMAKAWPIFATVLAVTALWPLARLAADMGAAHTTVSLGTLEVPGWTTEAAPEGAWTPHVENPSAVRHVVLRKGDAAVGVYVAYYRGQDFERKLVSSNNVLVRSSDRAWTKLAEGPASAAIDGTTRTIVSARIRGAGDLLLAWKWYWIGGNLTASDAWAKAAIAWSKLTGRGDDSALVVLYTDDGDAAAATLQSFVHDAWPSMAAMLTDAQRAGR